MADQDSSSPTHPMFSQGELPHKTAAHARWASDVSRATPIPLVEKPV